MEYRSILPNPNALATKNNLINDESQRIPRIFAHSQKGVLQDLGAAVILCWHSLPRYVQRELFHTAASINPNDQAVVQQIAHFLHNHKNDELLDEGGEA